LQEPAIRYGAFFSSLGYCGAVDLQYPCQIGLGIYTRSLKTVMKFAFIGLVFLTNLL